jgi:type IV pilus assembly protein PilC
MSEWITLLAIFLPLVIFLVAMGLRIAADSFPEATSSELLRSVLTKSSYALVAIGFISLTFILVVVGRYAAGMMIVFLLAIAQLIIMELKIAGKRRQAQQAELLWVLATTVKNNRDLADSLRYYAQGSAGWRSRQLKRLASRIEDGTPLSEIAVPQGLLSYSATIQVQAGIQTGRLFEALQSAAIRETKEHADDALASKTQMVLLYPLVIFLAASGFVGFIMYFIVPKLKKIFDDFGTELPTMTRMLIDASDKVINYWLLFSPVFYVPLTGLVIVAMAEFFGWRAVARWTVGYVVARPHTADLLRYLSVTIESKLPIDRALEGIQTAAIPYLLRERISRIRLEVEYGGNIWELLAKHGFLRRAEVNLLESAQAVGNLPWTLNSLAASIERRSIHRLRALTELMGPLVIVLMGLGGAFLICALFVPLTKLINDLS